MREELRQIRELLGRLRQDPVAWIAALVCPDHLIPILIILAAGGFVPLVGIDRYRVPLLAASSVVFVAIALWPLRRQLREARQGTEGSRRMPVWAVLVTGAIGLLVSSLGWRAATRRRSLPCPAWLSVLLENPVRRALYVPEAVIRHMGLRPGQRVLEVGPGIGVMSVPVARFLGPAGSLSCVDIEPAMIERLRRRLEAAGVTNAEALVGDACSLPFPDASFDAAFLVTVLGEIPDRVAALRELPRVLRPGGVLSFTEIALDSHYQLRRTLDRLCREAGFEPAGAHGSWFVFTANCVRV